MVAVAVSTSGDCPAELVSIDDTLGDIQRALGTNNITVKPAHLIWDITGTELYYQLEVYVAIDNTVAKTEDTFNEVLYNLRFGIICGKAMIIKRVNDGFDSFKACEIKELSRLLVHFGYKPVKLGDFDV